MPTVVTESAQTKIGELHDKKIRVPTPLPCVVHHYTGQWSNHRFCHLWGMLSLDIWRVDMLNVTNEAKTLPENTMATLRVFFQIEKRHNVFELRAQPDGSLVCDRLRLVILEIDTTERRMGGCFLFTGECPQACVHANSFQITPNSMLNNLEPY